MKKDNTELRISLAKDTFNIYKNLLKSFTFAKNAIELNDLESGNLVMDSSREIKELNSFILIPIFKTSEYPMEYFKVDLSNNDFFLSFGFMNDFILNCLLISTGVDINNKYFMQEKVSTFVESLIMKGEGEFEMVDSGDILKVRDIEIQKRIVTEKKGIEFANLVVDSQIFHSQLFIMEKFDENLFLKFISGLILLVKKRFNI